MQCVIDELKAELASMKDMIKEYKMTIVNTKVHLNEAKKENVRLSNVENYNRELKELLVKLGKDYSKDLPDIYQYFNSLTKDMLKEKDNAVTKIACKEFTSIEELMKISNENLPAIACNSIKLLFALIKFYNEFLINKAGTHYPCQKKLIISENSRKDNSTPDLQKEVEEEKKRVEIAQEESHIKNRSNIITPQAIDFKSRKSRSTLINSCPNSNRNQSKDKALKGATTEDVHESYANKSHSKAKSKHKNKAVELTMETNQVNKEVIVSY